MSDVSASSAAVFYEVVWSLMSMGSLLPQKLNRAARYGFMGFYKAQLSELLKEITTYFSGSLPGVSINDSFADALVYRVASLVCIFVSTLSS